MHGTVVPFESLDTHQNKKLASLSFSARRSLNDRPNRLSIARYHQQIKVQQLQAIFLVQVLTVRISTPVVYEGGFRFSGADFFKLLAVSLCACII